MNIAELSIKKHTVTWTLSLVFLVLGYLAYHDLPRLEDPEFVIKEALIITPYPGASPGEVEKEVTEKIEKALQELGQLKRVESYSSRGLSIVRVVIKDKYDKALLPQVWDEMRQNINDVQTQLPSGTSPSIVNDDFGDVYGVYFALTGEGYSYRELKKVAELLKRELLAVTDVKKIVLFGEQTEVVYVEMAKDKMAALGITRDEIFRALHAKNLPADSGRIKIGSEHIAVYPTGTFTSEKDFGSLFIAGRNGRLIYLRDVADIRRGYMEPPQNFLRFNGKAAVGIAVSTVQGGNVVTMGEAVKQRINELMPLIPVGMELNVIAMQSDAVTQAVNGFVMSLTESVAIVIIVLLIFMGLRSGLIIGFILILTIAATFLVMEYFNIALERVSLGALIIALGMLVDNAIVVVDGMKVRMEQGMEGRRAAVEVVGQNALPLLAATAVAVLAFASIGSMENATGEYCRSLYYVILISLSLSWLTAVTTTPLLTQQFLKEKKRKEKVAKGPYNGRFYKVYRKIMSQQFLKGKKDKNRGKKEVKEPYTGRFYQIYRKFLISAIRFRWVTISVVTGLFILAVFGFGYLEDLFFPASNRPQLVVECQFREGIHIRETEKQVARMEEYLATLDGVTDIASAVGAGHPRFMLTYAAPVEADTNYCNILVSISDRGMIDSVYTRAQEGLERIMPDAVVNVKKFTLGPGEGGKIQLRINGPDPSVLRSLAEKALAIMADDPGAKAVRSEWGTPVKVVHPVIAEDRARRQGIDRPMVAQAVQANFSGVPVGVYREGVELIPIVARAPENERKTMEDMRNIQIFSPTAGRDIPLLTVIDGFTTTSEDIRVSRRNRRGMIKLHCDARTELPSILLARLKPKIELALGVDTSAYLGKEIAPEDYTANTIPLKFDDMIPLKGMPGYFIAWSGEEEDSVESQGQLAESVPIFFGLMILIVVALFNAFRQPLIIWLTVPLAVIGVTAGLLMFGQPFGFMALLGLMSLSGILIKNAIVLIDQIDLEIRQGKAPFAAVVDSGVSRMRPVVLAALTTMLGMIPLFTDVFFVSMAVTIVFGLGFASLLTLVFVPTLYAVFFNIKYESKFVRSGEK